MSNFKGVVAARNRAKVLDAAERHFEVDGIRRESMADIAEAVGVVRATLYRMFDSREALFEAILDRRFARIMETAHARVALYDRLEDALIHVSDQSIQEARKDKVFVDVVADNYNKRLESFILNNNSKLRQQYTAVWNDRFTQARANGELTSSLSNERLIEGMRCILNLLVLRNDLSQDEQVQFLKDFLVPAILKREATAPPKRNRVRQTRLEGRSRT